MSSTHDGLCLVFQELEYGLTVEWDQQDPTFRETQLQNFRGSLLRLQERGLSHLELRDFLFSQIPSSRGREDLREILDLATTRGISEEYALRLVQDVLEQSISPGASWNPAIKTLLISGVVYGAFLLLREILSQ